MSKLDGPKQFVVPIFVGSTYEDLKEYRLAVREAIERLETKVYGMEYFGSRTGSPKEECLKTVRECQVYIGIFAMRYGSIDKESGKSMTHIEYEEAQRLGLPSLIYIIDENKQPVLPKFVDTDENAKKLADLKDELKRKFLVSFFTTPDDLARRISQDLPQQIENFGIRENESLADPSDIPSKSGSNGEVRLEGKEISKSGKKEETARIEKRQRIREEKDQKSKPQINKVRQTSHRGEVILKFVVILSASLLIIILSVPTIKDILINGSDKSSSSIPKSAVIVEQPIVQVPANKYWHDTGIKVQKGDWAEFAAEGSWWSGNSATGPGGDKSLPRSSCGACPVPEGNLGELVGKVDIGLPFRIGKSAKRDINYEGNLFLAMNENTGTCKEGRIGSCYDDNNGVLEVKVTVWRIK